MCLPLQRFSFNCFKKTMLGGIQHGSFSSLSHVGYSRAGMKFVGNLFDLVHVVFQTRQHFRVPVVLTLPVSGNDGHCWL